MALQVWGNFSDEEGQSGAGISRTKAGTQGRCDVKLASQGFPHRWAPGPGLLWAVNKT